MTEKPMTKEQFQKLPWRDLERFVEAVKNQNPPDDIYNGMVRYICSHTISPSLDWKQGLVFIRMRKGLSKEQFEDEGCWYPESGSHIKQGRFNAKRQARAYFCFDMKTAKDEVRFWKDRPKTLHYACAFFSNTSFKFPVFLPVKEKACVVEKSTLRWAKVAS